MEKYKKIHTEVEAIYNDRSDERLDEIKKILYQEEKKGNILDFHLIMGVFRIHLRKYKYIELWWTEWLVKNGNGEFAVYSDEKFRNKYITNN